MQRQSLETYTRVQGCRLHRVRPRSLVCRLRNCYRDTQPRQVSGRSTISLTVRRSLSRTRSASSRKRMLASTISHSWRPHRTAASHLAQPHRQKTSRRAARISLISIRRPHLQLRYKNPCLRKLTISRGRVVHLSQLTIQTKAMLMLVIKLTRFPRLSLKVKPVIRAQTSK